MSTVFGSIPGIVLSTVCARDTNLLTRGLKRSGNSEPDLILRPLVTWLRENKPFFSVKKPDTVLSLKTC